MSPTAKLTAAMFSLLAATCRAPSAERVTDGPLALQRCVLYQAPVARWTLPEAFLEVSGLAAYGDSAVLLHGDEAAVVGVFDLGHGEVRGELRPAERTRGDFEGVARVGDELVLMDSDGVLYFATPGDSIAYRPVPTGFDRFCELEGLAFDPETRVLLLPCKTPKDPRIFDALAVFRWSLDSAAPARPGQLTVSPNALRGTLGSTLFRATAVERDPVTGHLLVLSSVPPLVIELGADGAVLGSARLDPRRHPRAEGITIVGGRVVIADEGVGGQPGALTAYQCAS